MPPGPPPTTTAGRPSPMSDSSSVPSRPISGFARHRIGSSWRSALMHTFTAVQGRMSAARPRRVFVRNAGSTMCARATPTRSASPAVRMSSAMSGWLIRPTDADRDVDDVAHRPRQVPPHAGARGRGRPVVDARHAPEVRPGDHVQVVDQPGRRERCADLGGGGGCEAAVHELVPDEPHAEDPVAAERLPHRRQHAQREPEPVRERAAVRVITLVHQRGHERAEQIAPRDRDLDAVEVAPAAAVGGRAVEVDRLVHLGLRDAPRRLTRQLADVDRGGHTSGIPISPAPGCISCASIRPPSACTASASRW